ncbi:MAG: helix-turn-helix transcriptional regulator [Planctomycetes bacterium]|nr:helix-turn-helix transcriptional regulator [Planctomycetota bacterium]
MTGRAAASDNHESLPLRELLDGDTERGVLLYDHQLRQVYANPAARSRLYDADGTALAALHEALSAFRSRLDRSENAQPPGEILVAAESGRPFRATIVAIRKDPARWYCIRLAPPGLFSEPSIRRLQTRFRLTLREAEVALDVARGLTNAEVASHLGITVKTVKNALMAVFAKVEVRNRVELALKAHDATVGYNGVPGAAPAAADD